MYTVKISKDNYLYIDYNRHKNSNYVFNLLSPYINDPYFLDRKTELIKAIAKIYKEERCSPMAIYKVLVETINYCTSKIRITDIDIQSIALNLEKYLHKFEIYSLRSIFVNILKLCNLQIVSGVTHSFKNENSIVSGLLEIATKRDIKFVDISSVDKKYHYTDKNGKKYTLVQLSKGITQKGLIYCNCQDINCKKYWNNNDKLDHSLYSYIIDTKPTDFLPSKLRPNNQKSVCTVDIGNYICLKSTNKSAKRELNRVHIQVLPKDLGKDKIYFLSKRNPTVSLVIVMFFGFLFIKNGELKDRKEFIDFFTNVKKSGKNLYTVLELCGAEYTHILRITNRLGLYIMDDTLLSTTLRAIDEKYIPRLVNNYLPMIIFSIICKQVLSSSCNSFVKNKKTMNSLKIIHDKLLSEGLTITL